MATQRALLLHRMAAARTRGRCWCPTTCPKSRQVLKWRFPGSHADANARTMLVSYTHTQLSVQFCLQACIVLRVTCLLHALLHICFASINQPVTPGRPGELHCQLLVVLLLLPAGLLPEGVLGPPPQAAPGVHRHAQEAGEQRQSTSGHSMPAAVSAGNGHMNCALMSPDSQRP